MVKIEIDGSRAKGKTGLTWIESSRIVRDRERWIDLEVPHVMPGTTLRNEDANIAGNKPVLMYGFD